VNNVNILLHLVSEFCYIVQYYVRILSSCGILQCYTVMTMAYKIGLAPFNFWTPPTVQCSSVKVKASECLYLRRIWEGEVQKPHRTNFLCYSHLCNSHKPKSSTLLNHAILLTTILTNINLLPLI
jgi:hypothetical protein